MSPKVKKISILLAGFLVVACLACFIFYRFFLHSFIANAIQTDPENSAFIPDRIKPKVVKARAKLNEEINGIPLILDSLDLDFDDLLFIVETINSDEVLNALDELSKTDLKTTDQAFNILKKNIHVAGYNLEIFRGTFRKKVTLDKIKRGLKTIADNQLTTSMSVPVARRTVIQILLDNRVKIESILKTL